MTASNADRETALAVAQRIAPQFFAEGHERVYVAMCCGRVMIKPVEVVKCHTCEGVPDGFWVDPDNLHSVTG